jgi:putative phosphoribosyl transferase
MVKQSISEEERQVQVAAGAVNLEGNLALPEQAAGLVLFAHGSGSSRFSPRNRMVASILRAGGLATLLIDLLSAEEEEIDRKTRHLRFDIELLAQRLVGATDWLRHNPATKRLAIGYFGSSTGAAAALIAAVHRPDDVAAIVSRGGRPDLADRFLPRVQAPTLLIVGGLDQWRQRSQPAGLLGPCRRKGPADRPWRHPPVRGTGCFGGSGPPGDQLVPEVSVRWDTLKPHIVLKLTQKKRGLCDKWSRESGSLGRARLPCDGADPDSHGEPAHL